MTTPVTLLRSTTPVPAAAEALLDARAPAAPVIDEEGRLAGIVTELDLLAALAVPDPRAHEIPLTAPATRPTVSVGQLMTRDVFAVPPTLDVYDVVALMVRERFTAVPVVSGEHVLGMLTRSQVLRLLARSQRGAPIVPSGTKVL